MYVTLQQNLWNISMLLLYKNEDISQIDLVYSFLNLFFLCLYLFCFLFYCNFHYCYFYHHNWHSIWWKQQGFFKYYNHPKLKLIVKEKMVQNAVITFNQYIFWHPMHDECFWMELRPSVNIETNVHSWCWDFRPIKMFDLDRFSYS